MAKIAIKLFVLTAVLALVVVATAAVKAQLTRHYPVPTFVKGVKYEDGDWKWAEAKKGTVKGKVTFSSRRPKQPLVVYLVKLGDDDKPGAQGVYDAPSTLEVTQNGGKFEPSFAVLVRNQKASFVNDEEDEISHNVYFLGDIEADLGIFDQGESREHEFEEAGEVSVHCSIHKRMDGKFYVAPSPAYAVVESGDDSFEISGVPTGKYKLHTWQKQKRFKDFEATIEVKDGQVSDITVEMKR